MIMNSTFKVGMFCLSFLFIALLLTGCGWGVVQGSGVSAAENRTVRDFSAVSLESQGELIITQGDTETLSIEAEDNLLPHIKTEVRAGVLIISFERDDGRMSYWPTKPIKFNLTMKDVTALTLSGSGTIQAGQIVANDLNVTLTGSGNIQITELDAAKLIYNLSGSGDANFTGQVTSQDITIGGTGQFRAGDLDSQSAVINIAGSGNATLWTRDHLDVELSGAGSVSYYGSPKINTNSSGFSKIEWLGDK